MVKRLLSYLTAFSALATVACAAEDAYISRHAAKILPHRIATLPSPEAGEIQVLTTCEGRVLANTPVALFNKEKLEMAEQETELNIRQQRHDCNKAVLRLRKQREELQFLQKLPPERREIAQGRLKATVDEHVLETLDEEISITEDRFRLAEEQMRQTARKRREAATLCMPFDGRLQYHIPLPKEDEGSVSVPASTPIVTVIDDSAFYVVIPATDPSWAKLEQERLNLVVNLGGGDKLRANWHHQKVDKGDRGEALFYYFLLPEADKDRAFSLLGSNIVAELFYRCEDDWVYVSKAELAIEAGTRIIETWEKLVEALRPGYQIVFVGETHLCLRKQNDERADIPAPVPAP